MSSDGSQREVFGTLFQEELGTENKRSSSRDVSATFVVKRFTWRPSRRIRGNLPSGFEIAMRAHVTNSGFRAFSSEMKWGAFQSFAWLAGLAILQRHCSMSNETVDTYRTMHFLLERGSKLQSHLKRKFSSRLDLIVRRRGRGGEICRDVLPDDLGKTANGKGRKWSVDRLVDEGRERAKEAGVTRCTTGEAISYGLLAAAELNPLKLNAKDTVLLVRTALFDYDAITRLPRGLLANVFERLKVGMEQHQNDTQQQFNKWFSGEKRDLAKSLASQAGARGGKLTINTVQAVFAELAWRAYEYEAGCLDLFAQEFARALPVPMNRTEFIRYSHTYCRQRYLGNLTIGLMRERLPQLRPILELIWSNPGDRHLHAVFARMLHYYSQMSHARREADRRFKAGSRGARSLRGDEAGGSPVEQLGEWAEELGVRSGVICQTRLCPVSYELTILEHGRQRIDIQGTCRHHGVLPRKAISIRKAQNIIRNVELE